MTDTTPMLKQYYEIKAQYQDCLLFVRMGDFYEMFLEDAKIGARALEITLTKKRGGKAGDIPMCGIPYHAADGYISRLIEQGYKVAICEQVEDPKTAKGLVKRDVIRVITPGTVVDSELLRSNAANYVAAVFPFAQGYGIAYSDISTGEFKAAQVVGENALVRIGDELARIAPTECLVPAALVEEEFFSLHIWDRESNVIISAVEDELFVRRNADTLLLTQFKAASLESLGLKDASGAALAAAALLDMFAATQKRDLGHINNLQIYNIDSYLVMDAATRRNLELTSTIRNNRKNGSLFGVLDKTKTAGGSRLLKQWIENPLLSAAEIEQRLLSVDQLIREPLLHESLKTQLKGIYDLERLIGRVAYGNASAKDMLSLKYSCYNLPAIVSLLAGLNEGLMGRLFDQLDPLEDLTAILADTLYDDSEHRKEGEEEHKGWLVRPGYSQEVDELREMTGIGKNWLLKLEAEERERTGIKSLKVGYNKVFGYYIEVTNTHKDLVPENYIRKQTLVNAERFITEELKDWENKILGAGEKLIALENAIFDDLRKKVAAQTVRIQRTARAVNIIDCLSSLAVAAEENGYARPVVNDESVIELCAARHPVVEQSIGRESYVPNDSLLNDEQQFHLITGPNMVGKSTYMRQVALAVIMARMGSYIPASSGTVGLIDRIFTRVGASDDLAAGQSTFMVEMCETSNILRNATKNSLIILDEIGRGTSTFDGLSIAWAVSEYILQPSLGAKTLFATHYHELIQLADHYPQVRNFAVSVKEQGNSIIFLRQIIPGGTDKSYGIHVAQLAGLPQPVIRRAHEILKQLELNRSDAQLTLQDFVNSYEPEKLAENPILDEIRELNLADLRPIEALLILEKWQKKLEEQSKE